MSVVNSQGIAVHLESPSQSVVQKHESSNLLQPAFQKAIERAADKQAAADRAALEEIGVNEAACDEVLECEVVTSPVGDFIVQTSASSALAHLNNEVPQDYISDANGVAELSTWSSGLTTSPTDKVAQCNDVPSFPQTPLTGPTSLETPQNRSIESAQATGISAASHRLDTGDYCSIDTQGVMPADGEDHPVATSELMVSLHPVTSSPSASPNARGGIDQQAFDTLSHMLSRQNTLGDSQAQALTLKVIAGMPGVESLKVQQDQSGQWHLQLLMNSNNRRPEEQYKEQLLAELSLRGHTMGSVSIITPAGSALVEQEI